MSRFWAYGCKGVKGFRSKSFQAMVNVQLTLLGAGRDVGRSCLLLDFAGRVIMLDCGMHLRDERRFPEFTPELLSRLEAVVITHFHLDHVGALPYLTGVCGYKGPVLMTAPTRSICPALLSNYMATVKEQVRTVSERPPPNPAATPLRRNARSTLEPATCTRRP